MPALDFWIGTGLPTGPDGLLEAALREYEELEYEKALHILVGVLDHPDSKVEHSARAYLYMAVCFTALRSNDNAIAAFAELIKLNSSFRVPEGTSPSIEANFAAAVSRFGLSTDLPNRRCVINEGTSLCVEFVYNDRMVELLFWHFNENSEPSSIDVFWRVGPSKRFTKNSIPQIITRAVFGCEIHASFGGNFEFFASGVNSKGEQIVSVGDRQTPISFRVGVEKSNLRQSITSWTRRVLRRPCAVYVFTADELEKLGSTAAIDMRWSDAGNHFYALYGAAMQKREVNRAIDAGLAAIHWWYRSCEFKKASGLASKLALEEQIAGEPLLWVRWYEFELCRVRNPQMTKLYLLLASIKDACAKFGVNEDSIMYRAAHRSLSLAKGEWQSAIEESGHMWDSAEGKRSMVAEAAVEPCLRVGDYVRASEWLTRLEKMLRGPLQHAWYPLQHAWYFRRLVDVAMWDGDFNRVIVELPQIEELAYTNLRSTSVFDIVSTAAIRCMLLQHGDDDPGNRKHSVHERLLRRNLNNRSIDSKYDRLLVIVDFRLACVRFSAGLPPTDDLWYQRPDDFSSVCVRDHAFFDRVTKTRRSIDRCQRLAERLDKCYDSHWRQDEIRHRLSRLDAIVSRA